MTTTTPEVPPTVSRQQIIDTLHRALGALPAVRAAWLGGNVIHYIRALGRGEVTPGPETGEATLDPAGQATRQAEMLATAIAEGVLTPSEADTFAEIHAAIETLQAQGVEGISGNMRQIQSELLAELVQTERITQEQADAFTDIHARLLDAGLME